MGDFTRGLAVFVIFRLVTTVRRGIGRYDGQRRSVLVGRVRVLVADRGKRDVGPVRDLATHLLGRVDRHVDPHHHQHVLTRVENHRRNRRAGIGWGPPGQALNFALEKIAVVPGGN